jgi:hypothetical protein
MAPGVNIRSSIRGGLYDVNSGTSAATPHVAGAAALLWSAYPSLRHAIPQTEYLLDQAAVPVSVATCGSSGVPNDAFGWGRLDVKAAYDLGPLAVAPVTPRPGTWLAPPFPNPAHHPALLRFHVGHDGDVRLALFEIDGRRMRTVLHAFEPAGDHAVRWDGLDDAGAPAPPGLYLEQLESTSGTASRKLIWLGL